MANPTENTASDFTSDNHSGSSGTTVIPWFARKVKANHTIAPATYESHDSQERLRVIDAISAISSNVNRSGMTLNVMEPALNPDPSDRRITASVRGIES
jgi:hypothetical protein